MEIVIFYITSITIKTTEAERAEMQRQLELERKASSGQGKNFIDGHYEYVKKRTLKIISAFVLISALLSLYSYCVSLAAKGGRRLGVFTEPLNSFALFPKKIITVLTSKELSGIPPTYTHNNPGFKSVNNLNYDLYGLNAFYNLNDNRWDVRLFNFKNDSIIHQWQIKKENLDFSQTERQFKNSEPRNCILLPNKSLIAACDETQNLFKLDKNSNIVWHNNSKLFNHALNLDADSNIWVCTSAARGVKNYDSDKILSYTDNFITKVDVETGEILFDKSVSEILIENGYKNYVYGVSNRVVDKPTGGTDPIHLNDIQPILNDSKYWKKGDLFLSIRNKSLVFLYRPKSNKIIHLLSGPFLLQHDVDIISEKEISLFNNNYATIGQRYRYHISNVNAVDSLSSSEIIIYNFEDSTYRKHLKHQFENERISSWTEGFHEILSTGDVYVESQNEGKVFIMNKDAILLRKVFNTPIDNMVEQPHWIRIYESLDFL